MKKILFIALLGFAKLNNAQTLLTNLQGCYPLDCDGAVNGAPTGSSLDGTIHNVTCTTGHSGIASTAYQFGGVAGSYINLPGATSALKPSNAITVSGWYKFSSVNSQILVYTRNNCSSNFEAYYLALVNNGASGEFRAGLTGSSCSNAILTTSSIGVIPGGWYHVVFYIDNSTVQLYVNNVFAGSVAHSTAFDYASPAKDVILGGTNESIFDLPFSGAMDNVRFWDRQLTLSEISTLYNFDPACSDPGIDLLSGLEACYPLDCDSAKNGAYTTMFTSPSLNGTIHNVACAPGHLSVPNTAYQFHGNASSYISLPNDTRLKPNAISFTGWFYADSLPDFQYLLYTNNGCVSNFEAYYLGINTVGSVSRFDVGKSNSSCVYSQIQSNTALSAGWHHVAFYMDNTVIKLYVDGAPDNSLAISSVFNYNTMKDVILGGTNETSHNRPFKGRMDNLRFYSRELSISEVADIYKNDPICRANMKPLGVSANNKTAKVDLIYPNPNTGKMFLEVSEGCTFMIQDINGRNIGFNQARINPTTTEIVLKDKAEGFYFIRTIDAKGKVISVSKIIVTP